MEHLVQVLIREFLKMDEESLSKQMVFDRDFVDNYADGSLNVKNKGLKVILIEIDGLFKAVGYFDIDRDYSSSRYIRIKSMYILPDHRKRNIASFAIKELLNTNNFEYVSFLESCLRDNKMIFDFLQANLSKEDKGCFSGFPHQYYKGFGSNKYVVLCRDEIEV